MDGPVLKANQALVRSIPQECKQNLKEAMGPYGFKGWTMDDLTPNMTRRAQVRALMSIRTVCERVDLVGSHTGEVETPLPSNSPHDHMILRGDLVTLLPSNSPHDHMILRGDLVDSHGRWKRPCLQTTWSPDATS